AGTSAAIRLALDGFSVTLVEREKFPREKLCGEFISPECFRHFRELGVFENMLSAGGDRIRETVFYAPNGKSVSVPSEWFNKEESALGLSRAEMDFQLLKRAKAVGVKVLEETQIIGLLFDDIKVVGAKAKNKTGETFEINADLTIDATGRAAVLANLAGKFKVQNPKFKVSESRTPIANSQKRLVGFKAHLRDADIAAGVCEIYFFRGGYGGLNLVENGLANHCFLIRADVVKEFNSDARAIVEKVVFQNKRALATLESAVPVYDWLAVAVDSFGLKDLNPAPNLFSIGDAGAFIDPFTGSGMLMAMESGEIMALCAAECGLETERISDIYKFRHAQKFQKRLRVCSLLRRAAFAPNLARFAISALSIGNFPRKLLARATRALPVTSSEYQNKGNKL
ncbi:MAG: NAD(P)/FAD-dependent oxidoreductase, partial [Pyrinomonadaceae bacterium]